MPRGNRLVDLGQWMICWKASDGFWAMRRYTSICCKEVNGISHGAIPVLAVRLTILIVIVLLVACGDGNSSSPNPDVPTPEDAYGAVYVFSRDSSNQWSQQGYLWASNRNRYDQFGSSVALSGDTLAVGAPYEDSNATGVNGDRSNNSASNSGAVYVFRRFNSQWVQGAAYFKASKTGIDKFFGSSLALSGDTLATGATFEDSNATGVNGNQANNGSTNSGAVYVYQ